MNKIRIYMTVAALLLTALACRDAGLGEGVGYLTVNVKQDNSLILKSVTAPQEGQVFRLSIYRGENLVSIVDDYRTLADNPLPLSSGAYRIVAECGDDVQAGFDCPYYSGETTVTIANEKSTTADITCQLSNVKVTTSFDEKIKAKFPEYKVTVHNGSETGIVFSNVDGTADKTGYIKADGTLTWELEAKNIEGKAFRKSETYKNVKARQYYNISFSLGADDADPVGSLVVRIMVDETMTEKDYDLSLDFGTSKIEYTSTEGFDIESPVSCKMGDSTPKTLTFNADKGLTSLLIDLGTEFGGVREIIGADASTLADLNSRGIAVSQVSEGALTATVDFTAFIKGLAVGEYTFKVSAFDSLSHSISKEIHLTVLSECDVDVTSASPWAEFAVVNGKWFTADVPQGMAVSYKKVSDSMWTDVDAAALSLNRSAKTFSAELYSLEANTEYEFKVITDTQSSRSLKFMTGTAETVYNLNFDEWWSNKGVWYPYAEGHNPTVWDTANGGTKMLRIYPTTPEETNIAVTGEGKKAARLESMVAAGRIAAGNIYTGVFKKATLSPVGAQLEWGLGFSSKPVALKGYYDYRPAEINYASGPYESMKGQSDVSQIQIILTDWAAPFQINTGNQVFVDAQNDPNVIAYGSLDMNATEGYVNFTIPVTYRDLTRTPKYIVIVGAASKYGDYFTGGQGSVLYLDEFELVYDAGQLDESERNKVGYRK